MKKSLLPNPRRLESVRLRVTPEEGFPKSMDEKPGKSGAERSCKERFLPRTQSLDKLMPARGRKENVDNQSPASERCHGTRKTPEKWDLQSPLSLRCCDGRWEFGGQKPMNLEKDDGTADESIDP